MTTTRVVLLLVSAVVALSVGCAGAGGSGALLVGRSRVGVIPPQGILFSSLHAPISAAVSGKPFGTRRGRATARSIGLPPNPLTGWQGVTFFTWGDMSEQAALRDGGISHPTHVDYESVQVLMIYHRLTLVAYGD
jgi:hypothetical protein